ncbi:MAG: inorganic phosphate transporter [Candidatus Micrarchaeota archaeon]|nr:inorganic phosphate transporter [Candidatus Micrarchaeota archaeon]
MIGLPIYAVAFLLIALVAGNNVTVCVGTAIAGRIISRKAGIVIAAVGYTAGFLIGGGLLQWGVVQLLSASGQGFVFVAILVSALVFAAAHLLRVPQSFSIVLTMSLLGIDLADSGIPNLGFAVLVIGYWIGAMVVTAALVIALLRYSYRTLRDRSVWPTVSRIRITIIAVSFLASFTFGANTIGLAYATLSVESGNSAYLLATVIAAAIFGSIALSGGELRRIGNEIIALRYLNAAITQSVSVLIVGIATVFSIPISTAQTFTAGMYGASLSYKTRLVLKKPLVSIIATWTGTAIASLILSFAVTKLLLA